MIVRSISRDFLKRENERYQEYILGSGVKIPDWQATVMRLNDETGDELSLGCKNFSGAEAYINAKR